MNYRKEYAKLVCQVDRALSILEQYPQNDPLILAAGQTLLSALLTAEEHFISQDEQA